MSCHCSSTIETDTGAATAAGDVAAGAAPADGVPAVGHHAGGADHGTAGRILGDGGHPLSALIPAEIDRVREVLQSTGLWHDTSRIAYLGLDEPDHAELAAGDPPRRARVSLLDLAAAAESSASADAAASAEAAESTEPAEAAEAAEATAPAASAGAAAAPVALDLVLDLGAGTVVRSSPIDPETAGQVPLLSEEHELLRTIMRTDPEWLKALAARGIDDPDTVCLAGLSAGRFDIPGESRRRMVRVLAHHQPRPGAMPWAHPIDGLVAFVDLGAHVVTEIVDTGAVPIPAEHGDFHLPGAFGPDRTTQKPIVITQPEGPSFTVDGDHLRWEKWSLRLGYDMREGLVLHQIGFDDAGTTRPIVHRASIAEMMVPYADPGPIRFWQNYYDTGEYLLGRLVNSLELGCDCVGDITYFDVALADGVGQPRIVKQAICLHEEDAGVLWKHTEQFTGTVDVRRNRRLVISFFVTVGNYDYGFYWYLYLDGTIEFEAKATGVVFTAAMDERTAQFASELAPGLAAPYHQHLFCARLDMAVDGFTNSVDEVDTGPLPPGPGNPTGTAIGVTKTRLTTEQQGGRTADASRDRTWRIINPERRNRLGQPVSYVLRPEARPVLLAGKDSVIAGRARFATKDLWVTAHDPAERFPAGEVVNQSVPEQGLPAYVSDDRSIDGADLVLWHTFGLTHFPRTEDWPIMPVDTCGFTLSPYGFFDRNPTLDVPPSAAGQCCASGETSHCTC